MRNAATTYECKSSTLPGSAATSAGGFTPGEAHRNSHGYENTQGYHESQEKATPASPPDPVPGLVPRQRVVDDRSPCINPSFETLRRPESIGAKKRSGPLAPNAGMTVNNDLSVTGNFMHPRRDLAERDEHSADLNEPPFGLLAYIQENDGIACIQPSLEFCYCHGRVPSRRWCTL